MTFLHFSLLMGGAALVVVPVVLHLLLRGKPKTLEFPAIRFVRARRLMNQRRFRLKHLLLLALRMLLIGFLGLLLARPSIKTSGQMGSQQAPVAAALVFDTAPRMGYTRDNQNRLDVGRDLGAWIIRQLPPESRVAVVDGRRIPATFQVDLKAGEQRLERLSTTPAARSLSHSVAAALELLEQSELTRRELYVFTDMASAAWTTDVAPAIQQRAKAMHDLGVYVIDVGVPAPRNTGIAQLRLSDQVVAGRAPVVVEAEVVHWGPPTERAIELVMQGHETAETGGASATRGRRELSFDPETPRRHLAFELSGLDPGIHQGMLRLTGQDALDADDQHYFTVEVRPPWNVLLVAREPARDNANYMKQALAPTVYEEMGLAPFQCTVLSQREFVAALEQNRLGTHGAILLLDPAPLEPEHWERLGQWVGSGGGLGVFLGRHAASDGGLASFNAPAAQTLLAGPLQWQARAPDGDLHLLPRDYESPVLDTFRRLNQSIPWAASPVFRYWELGELHPGTQVAVPYADGRPAVVTRPVGQGRVVTMTTPVSDAPNDAPWNLLPVGEAAWTFVALFDGVARYLVNTGQQSFNYLAGQTAVAHVEGQRLANSYVLRSPDGVDLRVAPDATGRTVRVPSTDLVGNYSLRTGGLDDRQRLGFSVNLAPAQLDLSRLPPEQLTAIWGDVPYRVTATRDQIEVGISRGRVGRELFPFLMPLLILLLAAEMVLSNRFYKA